MHTKNRKSNTPPPRRHLSLRGKAILLNTMTLSKVTFLKNVFPIPKTIQQQLETHIFKHIWQFPQKEPIARSTLYLPKTQGGIGLIQSQYHSMAMRIKHFLKLKVETNQEIWVKITRYKLALTLYQLHIHTAGQKITTYFIFFYTKPKEPMIIYTEKKKKNT